jgi:hypothetical protein
MNRRDTYVAYVTAKPYHFSLRDGACLHAQWANDSPLAFGEARPLYVLVRCTYLHGIQGSDWTLSSPHQLDVIVEIIEKL